MLLLTMAILSSDSSSAIYIIPDRISAIISPLSRLLSKSSIDEFISSMSKTNIHDLIKTTFSMTDIPTNKAAGMVTIVMDTSCLKFTSS